VALRNDQYDLIMREYSRRQNANHRLLESRREEIFRKIPRIAEINRQISALSAEHIRKSLLSGFSSESASLHARTAELEEERQLLLRSYGYPVDYLEMPDTCPICHDTGFTEGGKKCSCFRQLEIDLLYRQKDLDEILRKENFNTFSLKWYPESIKDEATGKSAAELARNAFQVSQEFTEHFDDTFSNLFFYGDTGVGKTFLSHCIAAELLSASHSVLYFSSFDLFDHLAAAAFGEDRTSAPDSIIFDCDLLIIDDLGTELTNAFVSSQLFLCVNERLLKQKPTVISTNLSLRNFSDTYSERTFSRIASAYHMCKLIGKDIRILKKINGGK